MTILDIYHDLFPILEKYGHEFMVNYLLELSKETKIKIICIDDCPNILEISEFFTKDLYHKNITLVIGSYKKDVYQKFEKDTGIKIEIWPYYFLFESFHKEQKNKENNDVDINSLFVCMNYRPRLHRKVLLDKLSENRLLENNYYSWWNPPLKDGRGSVVQKEFKDSSSFVTEEQYYKWKHWRPKIVNFLSQKENYIDANMFQRPQEFDNCFLNLVTETHYDLPFITEKTFNSILWKKPFIILGYPKIHQYIENLGFRLPNEIDYSFDIESDLEKRIDKLITELKRLSKLDLNILNNSVQECVDYNYNFFYNLVNDTTVPLDLKDYLKNIYR